jgi:DNA-binding transcriptional LysR family regulator
MLINTMPTRDHIPIPQNSVKDNETNPCHLQNIYVSLKQWRLLQAVVDYGSYAKAAEALHISQSTLSYTITKLQEQLGVQLLRIDGRKAILTSIGKSLIARSRQVVKEAIELENFARTLAQDQGSSKKEIHLVFDYNFPANLMWQALRKFTFRNSNAPDIGLYEVSMLNIEDYMQNNNFDLAISKEVPHGCLAEPLIAIEYIPVAHPDHELITAKREFNQEDLLQHIQIITTYENSSFEWTSPATSPCWKMNSFDTALAAVMECHGYAWFPRHKVLSQLETGQIKQVPLKHKPARKLMMYLIHNQTSPFYSVSHSFIEVLREISKQNLTLH